MYADIPILQIWRSLACRITNFIKLVGPEEPEDLKSHSIGKALGGKNSDMNFSIWSRKWELDMREDYLGNYCYGYIGAEYWQGLDFDDVVESTSMKTTTGNPEAGIGQHVDGMIAISALRAAHSDMTDAEIFCRYGAGLAQLTSDKDVKNISIISIMGILETIPSIRK